VSSVLPQQRFSSLFHMDKKKQETRQGIAAIAGQGAFEENMFRNTIIEM